MGSRDPPADRYKLWPTWWSCRRNQLFKFLLGSVKGFLFCEVLKMAISYTLRPLSITQSRALPRLHVISFIFNSHGHLAPIDFEIREIRGDARQYPPLWHV
jgi:hypothetical protein